MSRPMVTRVPSTRLIGSPVLWIATSDTASPAATSTLPASASSRGVRASHAMAGTMIAILL